MGEKRPADVLALPLRSDRRGQITDGEEWSTVCTRCYRGFLMPVTDKFSYDFSSFDNRYAWVFEWDEEKEKIVTVRAYLDSALINQVMS